ncbi:hypothetical protein FRC14_002509 [Serendipita sp. 396]|nr:hypothetical protein FRC14_002509 [Serendipita sp. 396]KAG8795961.1 hypothetical protein FRC16_009878 [Serendipita sp. 398]KAG8849097.1 hypothetical protein FRB91_010257 [Serendipita sp. 411]KAG8864362.1 hypothetical protein FRC20_010306 [Serendipita sp. 405]
MANQLLELNGAPTPRETQSIKEYLDCRKKELTSISQSVAEELNRDKVALTAISNLESTLLDLKKTINISEDGLCNLEAVQSMIRELLTIEAIHIDVNMDEPHSLQLCQDYYHSISDYTSLSAEVIDSQVKLLFDRAILLKNKLHNMEAELGGWRRLHRLATASLAHLNSTRAHIEDEICSAKQDLHPIRWVPTDIWVDIFKYVIDGEFEAYLQHNCNAPLRSTPHTLSQVCQLWRRIVKGTRALWHLVVGHPCTVWSTAKYDQFNDAMNQFKRSLTVLINLSQTLSWSKVIDKEKRRNASWRTGTLNSAKYVNNSGEAISAREIFSFFRWPSLEEGYETLFIDMEDDAEDVILKAENIPFTNSFELVLSSRNLFKDGNILSALSSFDHIQALTIQNESPAHLPPATLPSTLPKLECLKLLFGKFPAGFQLDGYLTETLKEVHIHDNNGTSLPSPTIGLQLPNIHTLGINYPARRFLESVEMFSLTTLVVYTVNFLVGMPVTGAQAISIYR